MSKIEDGGPAFPTATNDKNGITVRDYFAARAMEQLIQFWAGEDGSEGLKKIPVMCYAIADLMLKERAK